MSRLALLRRHWRRSGRAWVSQAATTAVVVALLATSAGHVRAQGALARFHGVVVDVANGVPLPGTRLALVSSGRVVITDSTGRFDFRDLPAGINRFLVFAEGFPRSNLVLAFAPGESLERRLELDSASVPADPAAAQPVAGVTVEADRPRDRRYADFDRRLHQGRGQYVTRDVIEARNYNNLIDALRTMRGVIVECGGGGGCFARMARAPRGCLPEYFIDDRPQRAFALSIPIRDIEGIEVYTGSSDVPGEYAGASAGCGVIVIWTRNGPARSPAPTT